MKQWYVVHTRQGAEERIYYHLIHQGLASYLPRYLEQLSHAQKRKWITRPLFPSYVFVCLDLEHDRWQTLSSTVGIRGLVGEDGHPGAVPKGLIDEIRGRESDDGYVDLGAGIGSRPEGVHPRDRRAFSPR